MNFREIVRREFSREAMTSRARRNNALSSVKYNMDMWADYGDPAQLDEAIRILREAE